MLGHSSALGSSYGDQAAFGECAEQEPTPVYPTRERSPADRQAHGAAGQGSNAARLRTDWSRGVWMDGDAVLAKLLDNEPGIRIPCIGRLLRITGQGTQGRTQAQ